MSDRRIAAFDTSPVPLPVSTLDGSALDEVAKGCSGESISVGRGESRHSLMEGTRDSGRWLDSFAESVVAAFSYLLSVVLSPVTSFMISRAVDKAIEDNDLHALASLVNEGASPRKAGIGALLIAARDGNAVQTEKWLSLMKGEGIDLNSELTPQGGHLLNEALMRAVQVNRLDVVCLVLDQFNAATSPQDIHRLLGLVTWAISNSGRMNSEIEQRMEEARHTFKQAKRPLVSAHLENGNRQRFLVARGELGPAFESPHALRAESDEARKIATRLVDKFQSLGLDLTQKNMQGRSLLGLAMDVGSPGVLIALLEKFSSDTQLQPHKDQDRASAHLMTEWKNAIARAEARANAKKNAALKGHWVEARPIPSKNVEAMARAMLALQQSREFDQRTTTMRMLSLKAIPDGLPYEGKLSIANGLIKAGISVAPDERKMLKNWIPAVALRSADGFVEFCTERGWAGLMDFFANSDLSEPGMTEKILESLWPEVDIQNTKALRALASAEGLSNITALLSEKIDKQAFASIE